MFLSVQSQLATLRGTQWIFLDWGWVGPKQCSSLVACIPSNGRQRRHNELPVAKPLITTKLQQHQHHEQHSPKVTPLPTPPLSLTTYNTVRTAHDSVNNDNEGTDNDNDNDNDNSALDLFVALKTLKRQRQYRQR